MYQIVLQQAYSFWIEIPHDGTLLSMKARDGHYLCCEEICSIPADNAYIYYQLIFIEYYLYARNSSLFNPLFSVYYYCSHFTAHKIEALRGQVYCHGSQGWIAKIIGPLTLKSLFLTLPYFTSLNVVVFENLRLLVYSRYRVRKKRGSAQFIPRKPERLQSRVYIQAELVIVVRVSPGEPRAGHLEQRSSISFA